MKKIGLIIVSVAVFFILSSGFGLTENLFSPFLWKSKAVPEIVHNTNGGEKWKKRVNYALAERWISAADEGHSVDLIYFYPTCYVKENEASPELSDIDDVAMLENVHNVFKRQTAIFSDSCNIYAPYYRQLNPAYFASLSQTDYDSLAAYAASQDPANALDYYFKHFNRGKPFILAGHSQGGLIVSMLLADYMEQHPEYYERMIAAYVIGYPVTETFLAENPHLKFAEGATDTGVIISYSTESSGNKNQYNVLVPEGTIAINPINWRRDETYAPVEENLGSLAATGVFGAGLADARVDTERGVVVCDTVNPEIYADSGVYFGTGSFHSLDFDLYHENLKVNVADRINAYFAANGSD